MTNYREPTDAECEHIEALQGVTRDLIREISNLTEEWDSANRRSVFDDLFGCLETYRLSGDKGKAIDRLVYDLKSDFEGGNQ